MKLKKELGQVFTPKWVVEKMINLIENKNPELVLEPSAGDGSFYFELIKKFNNVLGVEIDKDVAFEGAKICSFFDFDSAPDVIIGNPPYVEFKMIKEKIDSDLLIHKPNLYLYFLEKCLNDLKQNGELIFIVPAEVFSISSAKKLNELIFNNYSITHFEIMEENIWENAAVSTTIIKIVKRKNDKNKLDYFLNNGKIIFGKKIKIGSEFVVKVGGVSGFNSKLESGKDGFVVSNTEKTKTLKFIDYAPEKWIRGVPKAPVGFKYQIFVNCKTRNKMPFYFLDFQKEGELINYDGAVLSVFVFCEKKDVEKIVEKLNLVNWEKYGILRGGRFHFSQSLLTGILEK